MALALSGAPDSERGAVVGTQTAFVDLAFGVGSVSLGAVAHTVGYRGTFAVSAGVAIIGLVLLRTRVPSTPIEPRGGTAEIDPVI
jgi:MFS family permease